MLRNFEGNRGWGVQKTIPPNWKLDINLTLHLLTRKHARDIGSKLVRIRWEFPGTIKY